MAANTTGPYAYIEAVFTRFAITNTSAWSTNKHPLPLVKGGFVVKSINSRTICKHGIAASMLKYLYPPTGTWVTNAKSEPRGAANMIVKARNTARIATDLWSWKRARKVSVATPI